MWTRGPLSHHASTGLKEEEGLFIILEVVFRSVQAFRSNQTDTFQWQWRRGRGRGQAPGYDLKPGELMTTPLTASALCLHELWLDEWQAGEQWDKTGRGDMVRNFTLYSPTPPIVNESLSMCGQTFFQWRTRNGIWGKKAFRDGIFDFGPYVAGIDFHRLRCESHPWEQSLTEPLCWLKSIGLHRQLVCAPPPVHASPFRRNQSS